MAAIPKKLYDDDLEIPDSVLSPYNDVPLDNGSDRIINEKATLDTHQSPRIRRSLRLPAFLFTIIGVSLAISLIEIKSFRQGNIRISTPSEQSSSSSPMLVTNCGPNITTIRAANCSFDMMGNGWFSPLCYDPTYATEALDSFIPGFGLTAFPFHPGMPRSEVEPFNSSSELEDHLLGQMERGERMVAYTNEHWHIGHCIYWWHVHTRASQRVVAGEKGVWVPRVITQEHHSRHCVSLVTELSRTGKVSEGLDIPDVTVVVDFGFANCVQLS